MYEILQPADGTFHIVDSLSGNTVLFASPTSKVSVREIATVARTDTAAKTLFTLPAGAIPISLSMYSPAVSNATTTAVVEVGIGGGSATYFVSQDVKTAAGQISCPTATHLGVAVATATAITGTYLETGTASSAGGPFTVKLEWYMS